MTDMTDVAPSRPAAERNFSLILGKGLDRIWPIADAAVIIVISVLAGLAYHIVAYDQAGDVVDYAKVGAVVAVFRWILQYSGSHLAPYPKGSLRYQFFLWTAAFLGLFALGFVSKISGTYSRGAILLFYVGGLPLLMTWQHSWRQFVRRRLSTGQLAVRRALLLGTAAKLDEFERKYRPWEAGLIARATVVVPEKALRSSPEGEACLKDALDQAVTVARSSRLDDVILLLPWSATKAVNTCVDTLMTTPLSLQLGPEAIFDRFYQIQLARIGPATMFNLIRPPLTRVEVWSKRIFDFVSASALLVALSPLLLLVAIVVKLDSPGPILFRQRRHGFNQKQFKIFKFRTMNVTEDGDTVIQATTNDPRVTRVGKFLRRWNIDELPQLINVLKGDMSLVGPRPHAVTHDRDYEQRIAFYARRHNIKPGITGWAQVNGLRGITDTEEKMQARVERDLYYIDNWSIPLDLYIIGLTVLSAKAFANAH